MQLARCFRSTLPPPNAWRRGNRNVIAVGSRAAAGVCAFFSLICFGPITPLAAQSNPPRTTPAPAAGAQLPGETPDPGLLQLAEATQALQANPQLRPSLQTAFTFGLLAVVPIVLLMTTGYVRMAVVLGLVRQGFGGAAAPPPQVITALAIFLTILVMMPVWHQVKQDAVDPYFATEHPISLADAVERGAAPLKRFMSQQLIAAGNTQDVWLFLKYLPADQRQTVPQTFQDVPLQVLLPAFMVSELKVAFAIGFQIYLPFLLIDLIVSSVITALGLNSLPHHVVSLPLKLALFVTVDGWNLIVGMLLRSFAAFPV